MSPLKLAPYSEKTLTDGNFLQMQPYQGGWIISKGGERIGYTKKSRAGWKNDSEHMPWNLTVINEAERLLDEHFSGGVK